MIQKKLLQKCNNLINNKKYTTQQIYVSLMLLDRLYYFNEQFESNDVILRLIKDISSEVENMYDTYEPKTKMEWNKFGSSLKYTYDELHHECLKEIERQKVIRKIKDGEITID